MSAHDSKETVLLDIIKEGIENFIIITGGIGDFLTIDFYCNFSSRKNIIFITSHSLKLKELMMTYNFSNKFYSLYFDFSKIGKPGFDTENELFKYFPKLYKVHVVDIIKYFPKIKKMICQYNFYNNIYNNKLFKADDNIYIKTRYILPDKYAVIVPYTEDNRIDCIKCHITHNTQNDKCSLTRNFTDQDYNSTFLFLKNNNIKGILISVNHITIDNNYSDYVINLSGKLTIKESVEITKHCSYYFGIDSFLSVIASKYLGNQFIFIKCNNKHGHKNKNIYWYPNKFIKLHRFIEV